MRARGATVTDLVVLVVAADDGVMPQTIEAIRHAREAGVPMIVAVNKIDVPGADPRKVREALLQHEVVVEEMGGDVLTVDVSAKEKIGLDKLEDMILLQAELLELKSNPDRPAQGVVIEARIDTGRGPMATLLVARGTLRRGEVFVAGGEFGRVRVLMNDRGQNLDAAGPAVPVEILGLNGAPRPATNSRWSRARRARGRSSPTVAAGTARRRPKSPKNRPWRRSLRGSKAAGSASSPWW